MEKECVLIERVCINCGECTICDLDSNKKCDNCEKCIEHDGVFKTVKIKDFIDLPKNTKQGSGS